MKATIEFNLPEEEDNFKMASRGASYWSALYEMSQLWRKWKYEESWDEKQWEVHNEIMSEIDQILCEVIIGDID